MTLQRQQQPAIGHVPDPHRAVIARRRKPRSVVERDARPDGLLTLVKQAERLASAAQRLSLPSPAGGRRFPDGATASRRSRA